MSKNSLRLLVFFVLLLLVLSTGCGDDSQDKISIKEIETTNTPPPKVNIPATSAPETVLVLEESAPVSCMDIPDPGLMDKCWLEQAQETMQIADCEKMSEKTGEIYNKCIDNVARLTGDTKLCKKISSDKDREACLKIVCLIKGGSDRKDCLSDKQTVGTTPPTTLPTTTPPQTTLPPTTTPPITTAPPPAEPILEVMDTSTVNNPNGKLWVAGKIRNAGGADAFSVRVILIVYNKEGKKMDRVSTAPIEKIAAGETIEFNMLRSDKVNSAVGRYEVTFDFEQ